MDDLGEITLKVSRVTLLRRKYATDRLCLHLIGPTPFPWGGFKPYLQMDIAQGYGEEWCITNFGIQPEVIDAN